MICSVLIVLVAFSQLTAGQGTDCSAIVKANATNLSALQPCVTSAANSSSPLVLDGTRRYSGGPLQALDFAYVSATVILLTPSAYVEVSSASLTGVRLASPSTAPLRLLATSVPLTATLSFRNVLVETDCSTLALYQQWFRLARPGNITLSTDGDLLISSYWQQTGSVWTDCLLTCARPPASVVASGSTQSGNATVAQFNTTVEVNSDLDLYNALALTASYDPGTVVINVRRSMALRSPLWAAQGIVLTRNVFIAGTGDSAGGGDGVRAGGKPIIDLQDMVKVVHLNDGVVLVVSGVAFANVGMVFGYAPVPFTGLGVVPGFMWFFDFTRTLLPKPPLQLQLYGCDIISYPQDIEHLNLWAIFLMSNVGPLAAAAAPFRVGVTELLADTASATLTFLTLEAYGMLYKNVSLPSYTAVNTTLMARSSPYALYKLGMPVSTTIVPIWSQSDLQNSLAGVQRLTGCSPYSNTTVYFQLFSNLSLDGTKWPIGGYNVSCNVTFGGIAGMPGGTWLNLNLLPKLVTLTNKAFVFVRSLTLFNMPSQRRTYDLNDLTQMTLPLWPIARPDGDPPYLVLKGCTIVLPYEEYHSLAATLGNAEGRWPSPALNASIEVAEYISTASHRITLATFHGFNLTMTDTMVVDTSVYAPSSPLLGNNIYGTSGFVTTSPPPPQPPPGLGAQPGPAGGGGGQSASSIIAVAVAVPVGVSALAVAIAAFILMRRRRRAAARGAAYKWSANSGAANGSDVGGAATDAAEKGAAPSAGGSGGTSPQSDQSGDTAAHAGGGAIQDSSAAKVSRSQSVDLPPSTPPLHMELHQLILDFAREIEDKHLTIHDALGSGGFATVYRGTWRGIDVAVKVIEFQDRSVGDERLQARAMTEAAIAANIQHANIVTTYSYDIRPAVQPDSEYDGCASGGALLGLGPAVGPGAGPGGSGSRRPSESSENSGMGCRAWKLYLIQEFCEVGSLRMALENRMFLTVDGQPNLPMILRLALDVVRGLQHLHKKNIVHGDLTPGNILLKADLSRPGRYTGKLADFGLSVKMNPSQTSVDNNRTGTPFYASPEVRQHGNLTKASDLYAFGVVLWEMWHGRPCYQRVRGVKHYVHAQGYPSFPPHCPLAYAELATRCLRRSLEERPKLDEVHEVLRQLRDACACGAASDSAAGSEVGSVSCGDEWPFVIPPLYDGSAFGTVGGGGGGGSATPSGLVKGATPLGASGSSARSIAAGTSAAAAAFATAAAAAAAVAGGGAAGAAPAGLGASPLGMGGGFGAQRMRAPPARAGSWAAVPTPTQIAAAHPAYRNAASASGSSARGSRQSPLQAVASPAGPSHPGALGAAATPATPAAMPAAPQRHAMGPQPGQAQRPAVHAVAQPQAVAAPAEPAPEAAPQAPSDQRPEQQEPPQQGPPQQGQEQQEQDQQRAGSQVSMAKAEPFYTPPGSLG